MKERILKKIITFPIALLRDVGTILYITGHTIRHPNWHCNILHAPQPGRLERPIDLRSWPLPSGKHEANGFTCLHAVFSRSPKLHRAAFCHEWDKNDDRSSAQKIHIWTRSIKAYANVSKSGLKDWKRNASIFQKSKHVVMQPWHINFVIHVKL